MAYSIPYNIELFFDGDVLYSSKGTTQGDPLAIPMYALATIPLIKKLHFTIDDVRQVWYAMTPLQLALLIVYTNAGPNLLYWVPTLSRPGW